LKITILDPLSLSLKQLIFTCDLECVAIGSKVQLEDGTFAVNALGNQWQQNKDISQIHPYQSVISEGTVCKEPYTLEGGHDIFTINDPTGTIDCAAYEPTKEFRKIVRDLCIGDIVEVYGIKRIRHHGLKGSGPDAPINLVRVKHLFKSRASNQLAGHMASLGVCGLNAPGI